MHNSSRTPGKPPLRHAFSLVELLTVIFIVSLLIAILVPSLSASRNSAKKLTTAKTIDAIKAALEMFKNENGSDFSQSNGYPPSFSYPPIKDSPFQPPESSLGKFPFLENMPVAFGAQWLPAMLMGPDQFGYIRKGTVAKLPQSLKADPTKWYTPDALGAGQPISERASKYIDSEGLRTIKTKDLPGKPNTALFPGWGVDNPQTDRDFQDMRVIADAFDQPILYYVATAHGQPTNMVEDKHRQDNDYSGGGPQRNGRPYYFHQDNEAFTGNKTTPGWEFGNSTQGHAIADSGADKTPKNLFEDTDKNNFAYYIVDRKLFSSFTQATQDTAPMKPVNAETFLLISAGVDGRFGTTDDVSNLPPHVSQ